MSSEVLKVISENPDLPIYAYVSGDVVAENDACFRWLGKVSSAQVKNIAFVDSYGPYDNCIVELDDYDDYYEYLINSEEYAELSDAEADVKAITEIHNLVYRKVIMINVDTID